MSAFNAASVDLDFLSPKTYVYQPKDMHLQALQVTADNLGFLAIEFETDIITTGTGPTISLLVERKEGNTTLTFGLSSWMVSLRGEIHKFTDEIFAKTFVPVEALGILEGVVDCEIARSNAGWEESEKEELRIGDYQRNIRERLITVHNGIENIPKDVMETHSLVFSTEELVWAGVIQPSPSVKTLNEFAKTLKKNLSQMRGTTETLRGDLSENSLSEQVGDDLFVVKFQVGDTVEDVLGGGIGEIVRIDSGNNVAEVDFDVIDLVWVKLENLKLLTRKTEDGTLQFPSQKLDEATFVEDTHEKPNPPFAAE